MILPSSRKFFLLLFIGILSVPLAGCKRKSGQSLYTESDSGSLEPVKNDWMVTSLESNPTTLNPVLASDAVSDEVTHYVFDRLIRYDVATGAPEGLAAESWTVSKDGLTYEFKLHPGMKFHDGKPVTAEDVKFSFDIIKDPKVDAPQLQNYYKDYDKSEVIDPLTIRIKMKQVYFKNLMVLGLTSIMPKHIYGKGDFNKNPANRKPIGSGPYAFVKWDEGRLIELKRVPDHWSTQDEILKNYYNFNKILYRVITENSVQLMALKKGDIDSMDPTFSQYLNDFKSPELQKNLHILKYDTEDGRGYSYIGWNMRKPLFQSRDVRLALQYLMPREQINKKLYQGQRNLAVGPFPKMNPKTDPSMEPIPYNVEKAQELLAKAGWMDSNRDGVLDKGGQRFAFELLFPPGNSDYERIALIYQQSLKEAGIEMNIKTLEWSVFIKQINTENWQAYMLGWGASLDGDPYQIWHSSQAAGSGSNRVAFKNARADELMEKARPELDREKRNKMYQEVSKIIAEEAPYTFLFESPFLTVITKRFKKVLPIGKLGINADAFFTPLGHEKYQDQESLKP